MSGSLETLTAAEIALLEQAGLPIPKAVEPLSGGANNRVLLLRFPEGERVLKRYFASAADRRDRFGAEKAFYSHAAAAAPGTTPRVLGWSDDGRAALFEMVQGRKLASREIDAARVAEAADFVTRLNAGTLPPLSAASEACFTLAEHAAVLRRRLDRLSGIAPEGDLHREALKLAAEELLPRGFALVARLEGEAAAPVPAIASPSDFGFHNALLAPDGKLRFFDFEYAGLDDPAKLTCDFFCQPEIPVPSAHREVFTDAIAEALREGERSAFRHRVALLQPVYAVKWGCILLNEFLPDQAARRRFSLAESDPEERRRAQLAKVERLVADLERH